MSATYASPPPWAWPRRPEQSQHHQHHHAPGRRAGRVWNEADRPEDGLPPTSGGRRGAGRRGHGHHHGHGGFGPGPGRRRASRGNVRAAVLALLAEEPQHGYAIIGELAERSGGLWRPSPGSIYPVLGQLQQDGLVTADETEGRRVFQLTEAGRSYVADHADELSEPWTTGESRRRDRAVTLFDAVRALGGAAREVARNGTDEQVRRARQVVDDARKALYRILAEDPSGDGS
ncbi:MAG: PadR family transcriptional regulator [Actinomycetes bacterium]